MAASTDSFEADEVYVAQAQKDLKVKFYPAEGLPKYWGAIPMMVVYLVCDPKLLNGLVNFIVGWLGIFVDPAFFTFMLCGVFLYSPDLMTVLQAAIRPAKTLGLIFCLFLLVTYAFSLIAFKWLHDDYADGADEGCGTLLKCFRTTFDQAFKNDGAIGGYLQDPVTYSTGHSVGRLAFDHLFNILLMILLLNILFGVIIDTFAELRTENEARREDMTNFCSICSQGRSYFDRQTTGGYEHHIKHEHNMFKYMFLIIYLRKKCPTEYTGIESYLAACCKRDDTSWFPVNRSIALEKVTGHEQKEQEQIATVAELAGRVEDVTHRLDAMQAAILHGQQDLHNKLEKALEMDSSTATMPHQQH